MVVVTGRGWGHGVGMSQWGARGYALHHWTWERILAHYYPGTQVSDTPNLTVRVLLAASQPVAEIACAAGMRVGDASGRTWKLPARAYGVGPGMVVHAHRLRSPAAFYCDGGPLLWDGRAYHGVLVVSSGGGKVAVVDAVDLEDYVRGVIGDEMPHRWPLAALEAQAVAARSYALATLHPEKRFDLYADDRSQMYGGIGAETPATLYAATQTEGKILTYDGRVATTYFFSTSGGRTADVRDVWPRLGAVPYLRSVPDPYDSDSPVHMWGFALSAQLLSARLGVPFGELRIVRNGSGRVDALELGRAWLSGVQVMRLLHLRSTWFSFGELSLTGSRAAVTYGKRVALVASARGVEPAALQELTATGWATLRHVRSRARVLVAPRAYTVYRLTVGRVRGPEVGVAVAPVVSVRLASSTRLVGHVLPRTTGAVTVSRYLAGGWRVVAHPELDARGVFDTPLRLRAGGYRIDVAGDARLAPASRTMHVTPRLLASLHK
ncbi:MAG: SpoIID/LytB domain-containing protein [Acidobacteriota bacterium]|nr:SpoIID/LytB domain-containing protein [Acidobacteriota bacterium]MDE3189558.1 SpoIID/LytB domain-containing protein [Acidobacteriota bacterium]